MFLAGLAALGAAAALSVQTPEPTTTTDSLAAPAAAAVGAAAAPDVGVLSDDDKIVCRSERFTGSRFPVRTCRTKKEWRDFRALSRKGVEKASAKSRSTATPKSGF